MRSRAGDFWSARTILLAPPFASLSETFQSIQVDHFQHSWFLAEVQRLRGRVYLEDGAIERRQLSADGRFTHRQDDHSWHLLITNSQGQVSGCLRYSMVDRPSFHHLDVARSALAFSGKWGMRLRKAIEAKVEDAARREIGYAELGGWALTEEVRGSCEALRMALVLYALTQRLGGAVGTTTATTRHQSSTILKKLGGVGLISDDGSELPPYYDPQYKCEMEILGFDSNTPNPKYKPWVEECRQQLANLTVVCAESVYAGLEPFGNSLAGPAPRYARQRLTLCHNQITG